MFARPLLHANMLQEEANKLHANVSMFENSNWLLFFLDLAYIDKYKIYFNPFGSTFVKIVAPQKQKDNFLSL